MNISDNYFKPLNHLFHCETNEIKPSLKITLIFISYLTVAIPLIVLLIGRIQKIFPSPEAILLAKKILADGGDLKAQFEVATLYSENGRLSEAIDYYEKAKKSAAIHEVEIIKSAEAKLAIGQVEEAIENVNALEDFSDQKLLYTANMSAVFIKQGNFERSVEMHKELTLDSHGIECFWKKVAVHYLEEGNLEKAFDAIKKINFNNAARDKIILKILYFHLANGEILKALDVISKASLNSEESISFLVKIVQSFYKMNDEAGVSKSLNELASFIIKEQFFKRGCSFAYYITILENHENEIFKNFISNLAQEAYSQSKVHLDIENEKIFLEVFSAKFKNPDTLEAFLRFKKGYKENEFFNTKESESYAYSSFSQDELYRQLELPKNASKDEIKASYRKLTRLYHPDKIVQRGDESESDFNNRKKAGEEKFKLFSQAYKSLIDA